MTDAASAGHVLGRSASQNSVLGGTCPTLAIEETTCRPGSALRRFFPAALTVLEDRLNVSCSMS